VLVAELPSVHAMNAGAILDEILCSGQEYLSRWFNKNVARRGKWGIRHRSRASGHPQAAYHRE
jgi:hypothetical protein